MKETIDQNGAGAVKTAKFFTVRNMAFIAVMAALICVAAPWSVPMPGLVPVSLATFAVYLAGSLLGWKKGTIAVLIYVLLGAVGLPVFSGFVGGVGKLMGPTGGYIIGFVFTALVYWLLEKSLGKKLWGRLVALGLIVCYAFGTVWFVQVYSATKPMSYATALGICVFPFLLPDAAKLALAVLTERVLRKHIVIE